jgi:hypothetical protein
MFGRDKTKGINAYGFAEKTLIEESMKKFKRDGNTNKPQGAASDVIKDIIEGRDPPPGATPTLPVCVAAKLKKAKLTDTPKGHDNWFLPCVCGGKSKETETFYDAAGFRDKPPWKYIKRICDCMVRKGRCTELEGSE